MIANSATNAMQNLMVGQSAGSASCKMDDRRQRQGGRPDHWQTADHDHECRYQNCRNFISDRHLSVAVEGC